MSKLLRTSALAVLISSASAPALAQTSDERIAALEAKIAALTGELSELKAETQKANQEVNKKLGATATLSNGRPTITSADGTHKFAPPTAGYIASTAGRPADGVNARLRIGAWATPTGLEDATSNTEGLFLERAAVAEMVRNLAGGDARSSVGALFNGERWYASAVLTGGLVGRPGGVGQQAGPPRPPAP